MLDPQTGNVFVLISSVDVQHCDAFIRFQKGPQIIRQTNIKSQKDRGRTDIHTDGNIILSLMVFEPMYCGCMCCTKLQATQMNFYCQFKVIFQTQNSDIIYIYIYF